MEKGWGSVEAVRDQTGVCRTGGVVSYILSVALVVLGVIGDVRDVTLGLEPMSWYLLAIAAFLSSIVWYIAWAVAIHINVIEAKSNKEE